MFDAICVGSGLIGGAAASALRISRILPKQKVLLVDSAKRSIFAPKEVKDLRQIAVNPSSRELFKDIGAWEKISKRAWPVNRMVIGESMGKGAIEFTAKNDDTLNYITEAGLISETLVDTADKNGVELLFESKVSEILIPDRFNPAIHDTDFIKLKINDEDMETKLIIGCDGANSMVRKKMGIQTSVKQYEQRGVVCTVQIDPTDDNNTAYQRFLPNSILAFLPCEKNQMSIVWSCPNGMADILQKMSSEDLINEINEAMEKSHEQKLYSSLHNLFSPFGNAMGIKDQQFKPPRVEKILSPVASFPLASAISRATGPRSVLLGDAAHRVHPMAGQGANMGYRDIEILLDTMEEFHSIGVDPSSELCLRNVESAVNAEHAPLMFGIDTLKKIYGTENVGFTTLRNIGTTIINNNSAMKDLFISRAA